jgi:hypothetical protein
MSLFNSLAAGLNRSLRAASNGHLSSGVFAMNVRLLGLALAVGLSVPLAAQAQMLQPGLWELTTSNMKVDNQNLPDLQLILGQLQTDAREAGYYHGRKGHPGLPDACASADQ